jgi:hypothetical protein
MRERARASTGLRRKRQSGAHQRRRGGAHHGSRGARPQHISHLVFERLLVRSDGKLREGSANLGPRHAAEPPPGHEDKKQGSAPANPKRKRGGTTSHGLYPLDAEEIHKVRCGRE